MPKFKKYILEIGPGYIDTKRLEIAKKHPDWLICILDNNLFLLNKYRDDSKGVPNFVLKQGNVVNPIIGLDFMTKKGIFTIKENTFDQIHVHGVFSSQEFNLESFSKKIILPNYIQMALENLLAVLKPGKTMYVSGEYGQRHIKKSKESLETALEKLGYIEGKNYKVSKISMSPLGMNVGTHNMRTYQIKKKG